MFGWLRKVPTKRLEPEYLRLLQEARGLQRAGRIPEFARKAAEAVRLKVDAARGALGTSAT